MCNYLSSLLKNTMPVKTHKINSDPRFTKHLVKTGAFNQSPLVVIDIGARGGFEKQWDLYENQIQLIGFEPDVDECHRLNAEEHRPNREYFPLAIGEKRGWRDLNIQPHVSSCSFYESDPDFLSRFADGWKDLIPKKVESIPTTTLDIFTKESLIENIDFIKLDTEGAELDIFRGASNTLKSVLGLSTEAVFTPWRRGMPTFTDIDLFLRSMGFVLYDLPVFRWARRTLSPQMFANRVPGPTPNGQVIWTQAIYFRDAVAEVRTSDNWDRTKLLKQASIMELYNLNDCAMELVQHAFKNDLLSAYDEKRFLGLLVPSLNGKIVSYSKYIDQFRKK